MELIFGSEDLKLILVGFFYLNVGILLASLVGTTTREPNSERTPFRFSWRFFVSDNWLRWAKSVIFGTVALRFSQEILGSAPTSYIALMVGFSIDGVVMLLKNKKLF
jgi:hypothetical protein